MLDWVLDRPRATLAVFALTLALTGVLYVVVPKGFFPMQDTGLIQVITEAAQTTSFDAMAARQQALADAILKDPDVDHLTSFIGVDGANPTLNTGRMQLTLKPFAQRNASAAEMIRRLAESTSHVPGITRLHAAGAGPDDRRPRVEDAVPVPAELARLPRTSRQPPAALLERLKTLPQLSDVATDLQDQGLQAYVQIDREAAGRLGVTVAAIDTALYNAFGQRLISTIYTQSSQYRVVLEAAPEFRRGPRGARRPVRARRHRGRRHRHHAATAQVPLTSVAQVVERPARARHQSRGAVSVGHGVVQPRAPACRSAARWTRSGPRRPSSRCRSASRPASRARPRPSARRSRARCFLLLAAVVTMYIVLGVLYESYIHPVTILSTLPSAGLGALLALLVARLDLDIIGIIGIVLLIGIVKKNAIMMIDFALDAEREQGMAPRARDPPGLPAALPADPDDDFRRAAGRAAADAGHRRRPRAAPSAGRDDGRRPDREPVADAVHDAGDLPRLRAARPIAWPRGASAAHATPRRRARRA